MGCRNGAGSGEEKEKPPQGPRTRLYTVGSRCPDPSNVVTSSPERKPSRRQPPSPACILRVRGQEGGEVRNGRKRPRSRHHPEFGCGGLERQTEGVRAGAPITPSSHSLKPRCDCLLQCLRVLAPAPIPGLAQTLATLFNPAVPLLTHL